MPDVYFVKMREMLDGYYDGYRDYFRIAELSGYPVIWLDEIDPQSANTYILSPLNGDWTNGWQNPKARIILHDLEWRLKTGEGYQWSESELVTPPGVAEVWASDKWYAGVTEAKYVPLGSHPGLVENNPPAEPRFDVTLQCYMSGRRTYIADRMLEQGITIAPSKWNPDRDALLKNVTAMLHIHQWDNIATIAPLRYAIAAAYALPLISEQVQQRSIFDEIVLFTTYDAMPAYVKTLTGRYQDDLKERGAALKELLTTTYSFRACIERAL